jgi:hypothetical protein
MNRSVRKIKFSQMTRTLSPFRWMSGLCEFVVVGYCRWLIGFCFICMLELAGSARVLADDDITLHLGKEFSVYSPSNCRKVEKLNFALALECNFHGKAAQFYLKEFPPFPLQYDLEAETWKNLQPKRRCEEAVSYVNSALRAVFDDIEPAGIIRRIEFFSDGCFIGMEWGALFAKEGFLYKDEDSRKLKIAEKCIFLRLQNSVRGQTAVLLAISEGDIVTMGGPMRAVVPNEVRTILGSLDTNAMRRRFSRP